MTSLLQQTLRSPVSLSGVGVHGGSEVKITIKPALEDCGIVFIRTDLAGDNLIPANYKNVIDTKLCTVIANNSGARVGTIEHLMSALWGCGVDNAIIEVDSFELPIMDGSARPFVEMINKVGLVQQSKQRTFFKVLKPIRVQSGDKFIEIVPADEFEVDYMIEFDHKSIGKQSFTYSSARMCFDKLISSARTFGFLKDINLLQSIGLARGASLDNAIGIDESGVMNADGLRYDDEFVRHKILDCIGDLYLSGARIIGKVKAHKASHQLHCEIIKKIFESAQNYKHFSSSYLLCMLPNQIASEGATL